SVNWSVAFHQDLSIPVKERVASAECTGWSEKEGQLYTQPPVDLLEELVGVRLHLDDCGEDQGPLRVIPSSHSSGRLTVAAIRARVQTGKEHLCSLQKGGVLVLKPLLLHASS